MTTSRKAHLVQTALDLFHRDGFHATGIDKILKESGVAKMTLYNHFRSKEDLILAALEERDRRFGQWFRSELDKAADTPKEKLLAAFDVLELWFRGDFHGCMFINAAAEFADKNDDIHHLAGDHKQQMLSHITELARAANVPDPETLAYQLKLLIEGAIVMAHVCQDTGAARKAKVAARTLLESAL
jgi:AcrR family transcriptional regulator